MVIDKLNNHSQYERLHGGLAGAFAFIRGYMERPLADGRYVLDGDRAYALVQSYDTESAQMRRWESHRRYIDVQFVADGAEAMGWAPAGTLAPKGEYLPEKDFMGYEDGPYTALRCPVGTFVIFWPEDAHKPCCVLDTVCSVKKIVVKLAIE